MKCLLCHYKEANQTRAHIFTNSLVRNCLNAEGKKGRDDELIFRISQSLDIDLYVGNTISTDKIEEIKGEPLSDEDLEANNNEIVKDNIFCTDCEKLFGKIESSFSKKILRKIRNDRIYKFDFPDNILLRLYFYIQIWRASSSGYNSWSLNNPEIEDLLRQIILEGCKDYDSGLSEELIAKIIKFPFVINFLETPNDRKSENYLLIPKETTPFYFFLCDFIVEFSTIINNKTQLSLVNYCGVNDGIKDKEININENEFVIRVISNEKRLEIINLTIKREFVNGFLEKLASDYLNKTGKRITKEKILKFCDLFFDWDNVPLLQRKSDERYNRILNEII